MHIDAKSINMGSCLSSFVPILNYTAGLAIIIIPVKEKSGKDNDNVFNTSYRANYAVALHFPPRLLCRCLSSWF